MKPAALVLLVLFLAAPAFADHWHDNGRHWKKHAKHHDDDDDRNFDHHHDGCGLGPHDVRVISEYYSPRYHRLPPGLQKKLRRTGHLPPEWERRFEPLPVVVERQLVPVPVGYRRGILDGNIVVYDTHTQVMVDVAVLFGR
jgi:hypothetical protein